MPFSCSAVLVPLAARLGNWSSATAELDYVNYLSMSSFHFHIFQFLSALHKYRLHFMYSPYSSTGRLQHFVSHPLKIHRTTYNPEFWC